MRTSAKKMRGEFKRQVAPDSVDGRGISSAGSHGADRLPRLRGDGEGENHETDNFELSRQPDSGEVTCNGAGISPQLAWDAPPAGTVSFALIVTDPDAPAGPSCIGYSTTCPPVCVRFPKGCRASLPTARARAATTSATSAMVAPASARFAAPLRLHALCAGCKVESARGATRAQVEAPCRAYPGAR